MTREKAIEILIGNRYVFKSINFGSTYSINTALDMAIDALKQEPCKDCISRQAAIESVKGMCGVISPLSDHVILISKAGAIAELNMLEPVTPNPKTGHWIKHEHNGIGHIECSECLCCFLEVHLLHNSYCPNCGAKMEVDG